MPTPSEIPLSRAPHGDPSALPHLQERSDASGAGFFDHYAQGAALLAEQDYDGAAAAAEKALSKAKDHPSALVLMAKVSLARRQPRAAVPYLERVVLQVPDEALGWVMLAQARALSGELLQSWEALERGRERLPGSVAILEAQHALAMQVGDGRLAMRAAMDLCQLDPRSAAAAYRYGSAALLADLRSQAREGFAAAVALAPSNWRARHGLGKACAALGELDLAAAELERALELCPGQPDVAVDLAHHWVRQSMPARAEGVLRRALQANPLDPGLHLHLALVLANQGRTREALSHAEQSVGAKDPEIAAQGASLREQLLCARAA